MNFLARVILKFHVWTWKTIGRLLYEVLQASYIISWPSANSNQSNSPEMLNSGAKSAIFAVWRVTVKNHRATTLCCFKFCALPCSHQSFQTGVTVRKRPVRVKISKFWAPVTRDFDGWPWKALGHLIYAATSFEHHFVAISQFKLQLQSGNTKIV